MGEMIKTETRGQTTIVTVSREKALNALNQEVLEELRTTFQDLSGDGAVRSVILTGAGDKAFVAGADIAAMAKMSPTEAADFARLGHEAMAAVQDCAKPVIAAVNGFALGGGLELALSCDFIYASEKAKFGLPEVGLGLYPGFGGTQRLTRAIGPNRARELIMTGRMIGAQEALDWGIVNKITTQDQLLDEVHQTANEINQKGPVAIRLVKQVINQGKDEPLKKGLDLERDIFPKCFDSKDLQEGLAAFLEKRKPEFSGQ